jgi:signal transduction histidine kinase
MRDGFSDREEGFSVRLEDIKLEHELESVLGEHPGLTVLNTMGFAIAILDTDLKIVWANREYHEIHGRVGNNIQGKYCYEVSFDSQLPCPENMCPTQRAIKTGSEDKSLGVLHKTDEGIKYLDVYCFPLKDSQGGVAQVIEVIQDNSRLHELIRLSENATLVVSHELKSPLASIATLARAILEPNVPADKKERFLYRIISRAESASTMIEEFLTLSAISLGELTIAPKRVSFYSGVIEKALDQQHEAMAEKGMSARIDIPGELEVVCDPRYMQIVYDNLITNATKYGTVGTEIHLGYVGPQDGYHYFSVINVGEWVKDSDRVKIFERYVTLGRRGTGIGLHTAKQIIEKHGGAIWVEPCYFARGRWIAEELIAEDTMIAEEYLDWLPKGNSFVFTVPAKYDVSPTIPDESPEQQSDTASS